MIMHYVHVAIGMVRAMYHNLQFLYVGRTDRCSSTKFIIHWHCILYEQDDIALRVGVSQLRTYVIIPIKRASIFLKEHGECNGHSRKSGHDAKPWENERGNGTHEPENANNEQENDKMSGSMKLRCGNAAGERETGTDNQNYENPLK